LSLAAQALPVLPQVSNRQKTFGRFGLWFQRMICLPAQQLLSLIFAQYK
jgi:hypothetical protein